MPRIFSPKSLIVGVLFLTMAAGTGHAALTQWQAQVASQLNAIRTALAAYGFVLSDADCVQLRRKAGFERQVTLSAGVDYAFAIACDQDCSGATLNVYDENGHGVGESFGNSPIVVVTPRWTGPFRLTANLAGCWEVTCEVGVALFRR
jgi:hypothetical protein